MAAPMLRKRVLCSIFRKCTIDSSSLTRPLHTSCVNFKKKQQKKRSGAATRKAFMERIMANRKKKVIIAPPIKVPASWIEKKPCSDVYLTKHFPKTNFTLEEAIIMHRELADPTMMDNMHKFVYLDCKVDYEASTAKKKRYLPPMSDVIKLPHDFKRPGLRKVIAFCKKPEDIEKANEYGILECGHVDLINKIIEKEVNATQFDVAIATEDVLVELIAIRKVLKDKFPTPAKGTVGENISDLLDRWVMGMDIVSEKDKYENRGTCRVPIGRLNMPMEQLEENLTALVKHIAKYKPSSSSSPPFIVTANLSCYPGESFQIDHTEFLKSAKEKRKERLKKEKESENAEIEIEESKGIGIPVETRNEEEVIDDSVEKIVSKEQEIVAEINKEEIVAEPSKEEEIVAEASKEEEIVTEAINKEGDVVTEDSKDEIASEKGKEAEIPAAQ